MSSASRKRALEAALRVFARYGYRRTSMADIAEEAGMSRPALYQWFCNKGALFNGLAENIRDDAMSAAETAWPGGMAVEDGLRAAILAKDLPLLRLHLSPHGAELLAVDADLTAAMARELESRFASMLAMRIETLRAAGLVQLDAFGGAAEFGLTAGQLASGLKHEAVNESDYVASVHRLCRVLVAALRPVKS